MRKLFRVLFSISKPIHKYVGLICLAYFIIMGVTGVLLNHPTLIRSLSVPLAWMPSSYHYVQWNRMALRDAVFSSIQPDTVFVAGKNGVWQSRDNGQTFTRLNRGFPASAYDQDTRCLLLVESGQGQQLYAGTRSGVFRYNFEKAEWMAVRSATAPTLEIVDMVQTDDRILAFTPYACYAVSGSDTMPALAQVSLTTGSAPSDRAPLFRFLLKIHDGSVLGFPGKLFIDVVGIVLVFLSISAIYIWFVPWRKKRFKKNRRPDRYYRFFNKYHFKLGIYASVFIAAVALTGMFIRPPFLMTIVRYSVPSFLLKGSMPDSHWQAKITRAVYEERNDTLLLATREGFFRGPADGSKPLSKVDIEVPVHGMGIFVMEALSPHQLLIGSFRGLYVWDSLKRTTADLDGNPVQLRRGGRSRTQSVMAAGAVVRNGQLVCWNDYRRGLQSAPGHKTCFRMPEQMTHSSWISLWHVLFELHNGRFFKDWLGAYTWLIIPVGAMVLVINVVTGSYDWLYRKGWLRF